MKIRVIGFFLVSLTMLVGRAWYWLDQQKRQDLSLPLQLACSSKWAFPGAYWMNPFECVQTPTLNAVSFPIGAENGAFSYNAQKFWDMNERRGGNHLGDDWNGIGGMDSDFGDPVYAVADGLVIYTGEPSAGWGKIVILSHRLESGEMRQSMYAHLDTILVERGETVIRGKKVGTIGNAHGNYIAHLHFEWRRGYGIDIGRGYGASPLTRLDGEAFLRARWREK